MTKHYINGQWFMGHGLAFDSINPANGEVVWQGSHATETEIISACGAAHNALAKWANLDVIDREHYILRFAKQVEAKHEALTLLIAKETGKPLWEARAEIASVISKAKLSIQAYHERCAEKEVSTAEVSSHLRYKPHGVVAVLGPFNFPAHLSNGHIIPSLLAGNTIIYKPSELAPAVAELIIQCWHDAGLPAGVLNCIQGNSDSAKMLLKQHLQGVYFTGSYQTGVKINQHFSSRPEVLLALEMGGNNPLLIDETKDLDAAVYYTLISAYSTAGQRCTCARRILIPDNAYGERFLSKFIEASRRLRVGSYTDKPEPFMGPVISQTHALAHLKSQERLIQSGGRTLLTMSMLGGNSAFLTPGIIDMTLVETPSDEEIFAPLVQIYRYQNFEHGLSLANQTKYGLVAALFSDSKENYKQFYATMHAGLINWNKPTTGAASNLPFGGVGRSGNHRPSAYFAADYCAYPIASQEHPKLQIPAQCLPGISK